MKKKIIISYFVIVFLFIFCIGKLNTSIATDENTLEEINYTESLETFNNPERGFYKARSYAFKPTGNELPKSSTYNYNLVHLRLGLSAFSSKVNGEEDLELTEDMLNTFDAILKMVKANGGTAIVRFAYDDFVGTKNLEPSLDMILRHIEQISPVLYENKDAISYIELGFFGPWGEMHSSNICTEANVSLAIDAMLKSAPKEITIGVRQPKYYTAWRKIDRSKLNLDIPEKGTDAYRVGLFNDGYLGSASDLGTFINREIETAWLYNQARHTFYGGEVTTAGEPNPYNKTDFISKEGFITHTTYLNSGWNQAVQEVWKEEIYNGEDELYQGQTGYKYIENHLGYRFVVRESYIKDITETEKLNINLKIENVGFANLINQKQLSIVLEKDDQIYEIKTNIDATSWNSKEITDVPISITLPKDIELGEWNVYLRISKYGNLKTDNNYQAIRFANIDIWNAELSANYVGNVIISEAVEEDQKDPENPGESDEPTNPGDETPDDDKKDDEEKQPGENDSDDKEDEEKDPENKEDEEPGEKDPDNKDDEEPGENNPDDDKKDDEEEQPGDKDDNKEEENPGEVNPEIPEENEPEDKPSITEPEEDIPNTYDNIVINTMISITNLLLIIICIDIFTNKKIN